MPSSQQNVTNIPSNRVDFIDPRTGLVSREWYRFFVNLFNLSGAGGNQTSLDDLQVGPPPQPTSTSGGGGGSGTVTSVDMTVPTGLAVSGNPITTAGTLAVTYASGYAIPTTAKQTEWDTAYTDRLKWDGGATDLVAATGRTSLGATTVGGNFFTLTNPSAVTFVRINADNSVSTLDAPTFRTAIGAGTGVGSVTSVGTAGTVNGLTLTGGPITSSGTITLGGTLDLSSPPAIGATTPAAGTFTTLTAQTEVLKGTGQNLILQSQAYNNATWNQSSVTRADNQTIAPDGSSTAGTITSVNAVYGGLLRQTPVTTSTTYTLSAYVKKNNWSYVGLRLGSLNGAGDRYAYFNLDTLATSTNGISGATFTATSVGSGWYRIVLSGLVSASAGAAADVAIVASDGSSATNNGAGQSVYVWGLQLELGSTANTYIPTTTTAVYGTPTLSFSGVAGIGLQSDGSLYETSAGTGNVRFYTNNIAQEQMRVSHTASAVNYVQVTGAATGGSPAISAQGSDSNAGLYLSSKGTGNLFFQVGGAVRQRINGDVGSVDSGISASGGVALKAVPIASQVNYLQAAGNATGLGVQFSAQGSDTNISQVFQSKGTGAIDLAAGSSGVNISNGGTVTAITRTAAGTGYTSLPSVAITAPTTAGGVQAVVSATAISLVSLTSIASGGTGYTIGDVLTLSGGTFTTAIQFTVTTVSSGAVTGVSVTNFGNYTAIGANPVSCTGGTGTGATFNVSLGVLSLTVGTAGSGYVEQPTVSFSGGGGSGAAAYATVGSASKITSLFSFLPVYGPSGFIAAFQGSSGAAVNYVQFGSQSTGNYPNIAAQGSDTNVGFDLFSKGTAPVRVRTGTGGATQFQISDTASAVNYVQVTGAATGGTSSITFTGSDANVTGAINTKGSGSFSFYSGSGAGRQVRIDGSSTTAANYLDFYGAVAGAAPSVRVGGSDTNIDLTLTPKGTGVVRTSGTGIRLYGSSSGYVGLTGAAAAGSTTYTLPAADGTTGQMLSTNGSGTLSWATGGSSNITAQGLWENNKTISSNYSVTSGNNALSAGPITVASGVVVTVPSGSVWTIV